MGGGSVLTSFHFFAFTALTLPIHFNTLPPQLVHQINGQTFTEQVGYSVAGISDVDGDGKADFIIGAPIADSGGAASVYSGGTGSLIYRKNGNSGYFFGASVAGIGDINGDGTSDFIIGAPCASFGFHCDGAAFIYSGINGSQLYQINGGTEDILGSSVAGAGDVTGDGISDFIIGAPGVDSGSVLNVGAAYVYSGANAAMIYEKYGTSQDEAFGYAVSKAGDVNGDGKGDFIVGVPSASPGGLTNAGSVFVYSGDDGTLLFQINGTSTGDELGRSVTGMADINGDGKPEFLMGAPLADPEGRIDAGSGFIYSGATGTLLHQINGVTAADGLGNSVAGLNDVDGDGSVDFIVGAVLADPGGRSAAGSAYVYSGLDGSLIFQVDGDSAGDNLGWSAAGVGDITGDGGDEVIIGAPNADPSGFLYAGSAYIYGLTPTDAPEEKSNRPGRFELSQNYPNPFNPTTTIRYFLPKGEKITLEIFNLLGERVKVLLEVEQTAGAHTAVWDGKDKNGKSLPSGIYFYRLKSNTFSETKKMIFLK